MEIKIIDCNRIKENDIILNIIWQMNVQKDSKVESYRDVAIINYKDPSDPTFVDYQNVNEEILISWVKEKYGESALNNIEKMLLQKLEDKQNEFINGLPF